MLRPRFELGSRTDLVLAGYKPAALPFELPEQSEFRIWNFEFRIFQFRDCTWIQTTSNSQFEIRNSQSENSQCARRDSNPPPRFKKPVLRHQSFKRKAVQFPIPKFEIRNSKSEILLALAAGFEPASTALEEQRLVPLGHASIQKAGSTRFELA